MNRELEIARREALDSAVKAERMAAMVATLLLDYCEGARAEISMATWNITQKKNLLVKMEVAQDGLTAVIELLDPMTQQPLIPRTAAGTPAVVDLAGKVVSTSELPQAPLLDVPAEPEPAKCEECYRTLPFHNLDCSKYENLTTRPQPSA